MYCFFKLVPRPERGLSASSSIMTLSTSAMETPLLFVLVHCPQPVKRIKEAAFPCIRYSFANYFSLRGAKIECFDIVDFPTGWNWSQRLDGRFKDEAPRLNGIIVLKRIMRHGRRDEGSSALGEGSREQAGERNKGENQESKANHAGSIQVFESTASGCIWPLSVNITRQNRLSLQAAKSGTFGPIMPLRISISQERIVDFHETTYVSDREGLRRRLYGLEQQRGTGCSSP